MVSTTNIVIAIDPGEQGAIAVFQRSAISNLYEGQNVVKLVELLKKIVAADLLHTAVVVIEEPPKIPFMNLKALHNQLIGYGTLLGIITAFNVPYVKVLPVTWQTKILPGRPSKKIDEKPHVFKKRSKQFTIDAMAARFPNLRITTDGPADAIAIGLWGLQHLGV